MSRILWRLTPMVPDAPYPHCLQRKSRKITYANLHTLWAVSLQGLRPTPPFSQPVSVRVEEEWSLDCWAEKIANEVPRVVQERARGPVKGGRTGTKSKHNPFIMMPGPSWLSSIWVWWRKLGLWTAGKLFKIPSWRKSSALILKPPHGSVLH